MLRIKTLRSYLGNYLFHHTTLGHNLQKCPLTYSHISKILPNLSTAKFYIQKIKVKLFQVIYIYLNSYVYIEFKISISKMDKSAFGSSLLFFCNWHVLNYFDLLNCVIRFEKCILVYDNGIFLFSVINLLILQKIYFSFTDK